MSSTFCSFSCIFSYYFKLWITQWIVSFMCGLLSIFSVFGCLTPWFMVSWCYPIPWLELWQWQHHSMFLSYPSLKPIPFGCICRAIRDRPYIADLDMARFGNCPYRKSIYRWRRHYRSGSSLCQFCRREICSILYLWLYPGHLYHAGRSSGHGRWADFGAWLS